MIKLLYRTFIISLLSGALITQSFAQTAPPAAADGTVVTNADGSRQVTNTKTIKGYKEETSMLSSVTMGAVGLVASRLYTYKMTTDIMLAAAGGAAFIVGEVMSSKDVNDETMKIVTKTDGTTDNTQVATLEKMKASLEKAKKGTETKKKMQTVAALAFGAAAAAALVLKSSVELAKQVCTQANSTMDTSCLTTCGLSASQLDANQGAAQIALVEQKAAALEIIAPSSANHATAVASDSSIELQGQATITEISMMSSTCTSAALTAAICPGTCMTTAPGTAAQGIAKCNSALATRNAACQAWKTADENSQAYGKFGLGSVSIPPLYKKLYSPEVIVENKINPNFFEKILGILIPSAQSGMGTLLFGAGGAAAGLMLSSSLGATVDTWLFTPMKRAAVWGVLAGLTYAAAQGSQANIDKLKDQIAQIDGIIASLKANGAGASGNAVGVSTVIGKTFGTSGGGFLASTPDGSNVPCLLGPGNTQCPSLANALLKSPGYTTLPADIQNTGSMLGKTMDQIQGQPGITRDAMGAADVANGTSGKLQGAIASARKNLNSQLVKMGQPAVDFNKVQDNLLNQLNKTTQDALNKSGTTPSGFLSSSGMSAGSTSAKPADAKATVAKTSFAKAHGAKAAAGIAPAASKSGSFNFNDTASQPAVEAAPEVANADANAKYEFGANDINSDSSASIFNLISERYFKSGYPKLLDVSSEPVKK